MKQLLAVALLALGSGCVPIPWHEWQYQPIGNENPPARAKPIDELLRVRRVAGVAFLVDFYPQTEDGRNLDPPFAMRVTCVDSNHHATRVTYRNVIITSELDARTVPFVAVADSGQPSARSPVLSFPLSQDMHAPKPGAGFQTRPIAGLQPGKKEIVTVTIDAEVAHGEQVTRETVKFRFAAVFTQHFVVWIN